MYDLIIHSQRKNRKNLVRTIYKKEQKNNNLKIKIMKTENILAVTKLGVDYGWFTLVTMNGTELTVYNHGTKWEVDNTQKEAEIMVLETDKSGQIMRSIIRGTKKAIENFMYSLGYGTANKKSDSVYQHTIAELQSKTQNLIWEIEELKEKLELKIAE